MTRKTLIAAIEKLVAQLGYTFYSGLEYNINGQVKKYPAAWLIPPKLIDIKGRQQGYIRYSIDIKLLSQPKYNTNKEEIWSKMETDAITLFRAMAENNSIQNITNTRCTPDELTFTNKGELSCAISFDADVLYCNS